MFDVGDWVLVGYDDKLYLGEVSRILSRKVEIMAHIGILGRFKWPRHLDIYLYPIEDIVRKLTKPEPCDSRAVNFCFPNESF